MNHDVKTPWFLCCGLEFQRRSPSCEGATGWEMWGCREQGRDERGPVTKPMETSVRRCLVINHLCEIPIVPKSLEQGSLLTQGTIPPQTPPAKLLQLHKQPFPTGALGLVSKIIMCEKIPEECLILRLPHPRPQNARVPHLDREYLLPHGGGGGDHTVSR